MLNQCGFLKQLNIGAINNRRHFALSTNHSTSCSSKREDAAWELVQAAALNMPTRCSSSPWPGANCSLAEYSVCHPRRWGRKRLLKSALTDRIHVHATSENSSSPPFEVPIFNAEHRVSRPACGASRRNGETLNGDDDLTDPRSTHVGLHTGPGKRESGPSVGETENVADCRSCCSHRIGSIVPTFASKIASARCSRLRPAQCITCEACKRKNSTAKNVVWRYARYFVMRFR